jgi:ureidoacrylate peracid hydrolase
MHKVNIPKHVLERALIQRNGKEHLFETLDMEKVAHIIVDLQVGFVAEGAPVEVPATREIFGEVNNVSRAVREAGGLNVFLRFTYDGNEKLPWNVWYRNYLSPANLEIMRAGFSRDAPYWQLPPELEVTDHDLVIDKTRFSALIPGTCSMDAELKARGIDTLIISGTLTNCCCESTARDALQMGYNVVFLTDANATLSDEEHNATLISMTSIFADVMDTKRLLGLIEHSRALAPAG